MLKFFFFCLLLILVLSKCTYAVTYEADKYYSTKREQGKIVRAALKVNETISSQCFADFMGNRKLMSTNGRTPLQVVEHLRSLNQTVKVKMYSRCMRFGFKCPVPTSAVAYREPPELVINLNRYAFYSSISDCEWASTMAHEGLGHALGNYDHPFEWTTLRDFTVPYSLGGSVKKNGGDAFTKCCR